VRRCSARLPQEVVAVGTEGGLFEERGDELVTHRLVDLRVLDGTSSLGNTATVSRGYTHHINNPL